MSLDNTLEKLPIIGPIYEFAKSIIKAILCLCTCGCCLIIVGIIFLLLAANNTHDEDVDAFLQKTKEWQNVYTNKQTTFNTAINAAGKFSLTGHAGLTDETSDMTTAVTVDLQTITGGTWDTSSGDKDEFDSMKTSLGGVDPRTLYIGSSDLVNIHFNLKNLAKRITASGGLESPKTLNQLTFTLNSSGKNVKISPITISSKSSTLYASGVTKPTKTSHCKCSSTDDHPIYSVGKCYCASARMIKSAYFWYNIETGALTRNFSKGTTDKLTCQKKDGSSYDASTDNCYINTSNHKYSDESSWPVNFIVEGASSQNPFTTYSGFGMEAGTQVTIGLVCLILGILMVAAFITIIVVLIRCIVPKKKEAKTQAAPLAPVQGQPMMAGAPGAPMPGQVM